jgi:hypothetical protein
MHIAIKSRSKRSWHHALLLINYLMVLLTACALPAISQSTPQSPTETTMPTALPQQTLITFELTLQQPLGPGESLAWNLLDEVTGLGINPITLLMTAQDSTHYSVIVPFDLGRIIKYRYTRIGGSTVQEHLSDGRSVRYRLYHVEGPGIVQDTLSRWTDTYFTGPSGRISGQITDTTTGEPIPNLLISAGGAQALTTADGRYLLEGLPPGTHNLVAYSIDGSYQTYQQGATVAPDSTTPASFGLTKSIMVPVVFLVTAPENTPVGAPLRLAGNLTQLGNTFADLAGGISTIASRMPVMSQLPDGRYAVTLNLPSGADIEYKYTLGDGLWNAEHSADGTFVTRHLIVPTNMAEINDVIDNWGTGQIAPIQFDITVPSYTPSDEGVSIQFNPGFGWLQALPMWQAYDAQANPIWRFVLISPLQVLETLQYRICRADQCGIADDISTMGMNATGHWVNTSRLPQTILYTVNEWAWLPGVPQPASIPNIPVNTLGPDFVAGIGFDADYHPSWGSHLQNAITISSNLHANWLFLLPTWTYTRNQPLVLEPLPSQDMPLPELLASIQQAHNLGMNVGLYPSPNFPFDYEQWWQDSTRDFPWWIVWFDRYTQFILNYSDISERYNVQALIIGGEWLSPALPRGTLADGSPSGVPEDAVSRWRDIISQIRNHYSGTIIWALPYPEGLQNPPAFLDAVDQVIILWTAPLSNNPGASVTELQVEAIRILDQEIQPFQTQFAKPVILGIAYPSADGSSTGCAESLNGSCYPNNLLTASSPEVYQVNLDLQEQADLYNAMFMAINDRPWIRGLISMGFYPPVALQDPSVSVYYKPASGVLWYWFPRLLGIQP